MVHVASDGDGDGEGRTPPALADLRRRVYGRDARPEDVRRLREALAESDGGGEVAAAEPVRTGGRRGRPLLLAALLGAVLIGAIVVAAAAPRRQVEPRIAIVTPSVAAPVVPVALPVPADARAELLAALRAGRTADLATLFLTHPDSRPVEVTTLSRADTEQYTGEGSGGVSLNPSALADRGGRITVILVLDRPARAYWAASRPSGDDPIRPDANEVLGAADGPYVAGVPASATAAYRGTAPVRLDVRVPAGVRWGAAVVLSD